MRTQTDHFIPDHNPFANFDLKCKYFDEETFVNSFSNKKDGIILNINIQSLQSKFSQLSEFLFDLSAKNVEIDLISIQETWNITDSSKICIPGFQKFVFKTRNNSRGGGVGFYVREGIKFKIIDELSPFHEKVFESLTIEVELEGDKKTLFTSLYRPPGNNSVLTPNEQINSFFEYYEQLLSEISIYNKDSYILTDSNIDLLSLNRNTNSSRLVELSLSHGFLNLITKASRMNKNSYSLIDQIFTNSDSKNFNSGVLLSDISDHFFTFSSISKKAKKKSLKTKKNVRLFTDIDIENFGNTLSNLSWNDVIESNEVEVSFNIFWDTFSTLFDLNFPERSITMNKNYNKIQGFMTNGLLTSRRHKNLLHKQSLVSPTVDSINCYKKYRNLYNSLIRLSKKLYFEKKLSDNQKDPKKTWKFLNESINKIPSKSSNIQEVKINNTIISDPVEMANSFNTFFSEIGENISTSIPETRAKPENFNNEEENHNIYDFSFSVVTPDMLFKAISSLESKSSLDIDNLNTKVLKKVAPHIIKPLTHICNLSIGNGKFPSKLKVSRTVPVFKAGHEDNVSNYRPISCLPVLSKIIERLVCDQLLAYLISHKLLYRYQFGFQKKNSTFHPLIHIINYISSAFNNNEIAVAVYLDLQKAFDVVDHKILLMKLSSLGIKGTALKWFESYLKDRKQFVMVNGVLSDFFAIVNIYVFYGLILGAILFLYYINHMH